MCLRAAPPFDIEMTQRRNVGALPFACLTLVGEAGHRDLNGKLCVPSVVSEARPNGQLS